MGWLGWTEQQTLDTRIPAIMLAYKGRCGMWRAVFGSGEANPKTQAEVAQAEMQSFLRRAAG